MPSDFVHNRLAGSDVVDYDINTVVTQVSRTLASCTKFSLKMLAATNSFKAPSVRSAGKGNCYNAVICLRPVVTRPYSLTLEIYINKI